MFRDGLLAPGEAATRASDGTAAVHKDRALLAPREQDQGMDAVKLYADTEELAQDYSRASGLRFGVLPLPVRGPSPAKLRAQTQALELAFLGEARDEKGFHWLPHLIDRLMDEYVRPGRVRFLVQATVGTPAVEPLERFGAGQAQELFASPCRNLRPDINAAIARVRRIGQSR